ncbi:MAG: ribonuclease III [Holophagales bacterium]|nr:ribonuclease III [Holophagales bacterium]MYG31985.1 ribonuclease III [Holophagales bacterium]MYI79056.1 ribonuclease III [Holophagales bacterium]
MTDPVEDLETRLGHRFENRALLEQALTHSSFANERGLEQDNERLEFLGDSVLGLVVANRLFRSDPAAPEGVLSRTRSHVVSSEALARRARELDLGPALRLGHGEDQSGGREKPSLLADALEAVIGAVFVDGGLQAARELVEPWIGAEAADTMDALDAKSNLQESLQSQGLEPPFYRHVGRDGPDHDPVFHVECWVGGRVVAAASGHSKKEAERRAAARALAGLENADR